MIFLGLFCFWAFTVLLLWASKRELFRETWHEVYFTRQIIVIESDDWGPGGVDQERGLTRLLDILRRHKDKRGRPAVLTANIILSVPDIRAIAEASYARYEQKTLMSDYVPMYRLLLDAQKEGILFPQLHGLSHIYASGLLRLARKGDPTVRSWFKNHVLDWESLPHPLQAHYVDGTRLPSNPLPFYEQKEIVANAMHLFHEHFGLDSVSTVAPCYLWNEDTEKAWKSVGIRYIQTPGYRCTGLNENAGYQQDPPIIRPGDRNKLGQFYLVRTVMFEPRDNYKAEQICWKGIRRAFSQGLPAVICTHRYNYSGPDTGADMALAAFDRLLNKLLLRCSGITFLNSAELGEIVEAKNKEQDEFPMMSRVQRSRYMLYRLWWRHKKFRYISIATLLIIPIVLFVIASYRAQKTLPYYHS